MKGHSLNFGFCSNPENHYFTEQFLLVTLWRNFHSTSWVLILNTPWRYFPSSSWFAHTQKESLAPKFACLTSTWYGIVLCYLFLGSWTWRHAYKGDNFLLPFSNPNSPMDKCWRPIFCHYSGPYSSFKGWALQGYNRVMDELGLVPLRRINLFLRTSLCTNSNPKIQKGKIHICIWMN